MFSFCSRILSWLHIAFSSQASPASSGLWEFPSLSLFSRLWQSSGVLGRYPVECSSLWAWLMFFSRLDWGYIYNILFYFILFIFFYLSIYFVQEVCLRKSVSSFFFFTIHIFNTLWEASEKQQWIFKRTMSDTCLTTLRVGEEGSEPASTVPCM